MAIHPDVEGLSVTVCIDGCTTTEYATPNDPYKPEPPFEDPAVAIHQEQCTVTSYIESRTNKEFTIEISVDKRFRLDCATLSFSTCVDEDYIDMTFMEAADFMPDKTWRYTVDGATVRSEKGTLRGFIKKKIVFKKIATTDRTVKDNVIQDQKDAPSGTGQILVEVFRQGHIKEAKNAYQDHKFDAVKDEEVVSGKAVINKTHRTSLGAALKLERSQHYKPDYIDDLDYPLANFVFKYCSRNALQSLMVVPMTPDPEVEEILASARLVSPASRKTRNGLAAGPRVAETAVRPEDVNTLSDEEKVRAVLFTQHTRARSQPSSVPNLKHELGSAAPEMKFEKDAEIKQENTERPTKRRKRPAIGKVVQSQPIDLTEDDEVPDSIPLDDD